MGSTARAIAKAEAAEKNRQKQLTANARKRQQRRNEKSDQRCIDNPTSAMARQLKTRHHARSGVIQYGDEYATFGASRSEWMQGIQPGELMPATYNDRGQIEHGSYIERIDVLKLPCPHGGETSYVIKSRTISVRHLLLAGGVTIFDWDSKLNGYVIGEPEYLTLQRQGYLS